MAKPADYDELVLARLFDFFNRHAPWHLSLWGIGTVLSIKEVVEYSELTRGGAIRKEGLLYVLESTQRVVADDPGIGTTPLGIAILAALDDKKLPKADGESTLAHLAERASQGYMSSLAVAARLPDPPGVEALSAAAASHLLDLGFSNDFLRSWLRDQVKKAPTTDIANVLDEADSLCSAPMHDYNVLVPFSAMPTGYPGPMPAGWMTSGETASALSAWATPPKGDLRQAGGLTLKITARDGWSAVVRAGELVAQVTARVAVGSRHGHLRTKGFAWIENQERTYPLRSRTRVQLRSLKSAEDMFRLSFDQADAAVYDALEIFGALESGTRGAEVTSGWAAVEALLLRSDESPGILAADRLAAIVACAFPRAEMTSLSHKHAPSAADDLTRALDGIDENLERCRILERAMRAGAKPVVSRPSDKAMTRRVQAMIVSPSERLGNVQRYVNETVRRLYTQRNLIMHAGSFQSATLNATLRTAPKLVGAGVDRIIDAYMDDPRAEPLALASRAHAELSLVGASSGRPICELLD